MARHSEAEKCSHLCDPQTLESHVPANVFKMLSSAVKLLGEHVILAKSNLRQWWKLVESALQTAHPHLPHHLAIGGIENMGPILLGAAAWEQVMDKDVSIWACFKCAVNSEFGFTVS